MAAFLDALDKHFAAVFFLGFGLVMGIGYLIRTWRGDGNRNGDEGDDE